MLKHLRIVFALVIPALLLVSCSSSPQSTYDRFHAACDKGDTATAESLATSSAINANMQYGVCILTHDGLDRVYGTHTFKFTDQSPQVDVVGNTAHLTWQTTTGKTIQVTLFKVDGKWKIQETRIFG